MRKLKLQVQVSLDGYMGGANGELDWMVWDWDEELKQHVTALTESVDCIVLGRKLAEGFIPHWAANPNEEGAAKFNDTPKVVFTKTLEQSPWENTTLAKGELVEEITALKQAAGNDLIVYGGASFVSALIQEGLIDEYHLFINPVALGDGLPVFSKLHTRQPLTLVKAKAFTCGITALHYRRSV